MRTIAGPNHETRKPHALHIFVGHRMKNRWNGAVESGVLSEFEKESIIEQGGYREIRDLLGSSLGNGHSRNDA